MQRIRFQTSVGPGAAGRTLLAALAYMVAAVAFTWPLALGLSSRIPALDAADAAGDPSLNLWALGWDLGVLSAHPGWLLSGRVFEASIYFPASHTLAYSDHLLLQAILIYPLYALSRDLVLCYNVLLFLSLAASALAMHLLARRLAGSERAAYVAGLVYGFAPYHFAHVTHVQLQALCFLPLSLLFLHRLFETGRRADAVALGLAVGLQIVSSVYYGLIGGLGLVVAAVILAVLTRRFTDWRLLRRGLIAAAVALIVAVPWSIPYVRVQRETGAGRNLYEASAGSAVLASYAQVPPANLLYGRTGWLRPSPSSRLARKDGAEQALFPGFCALLLALAGLLVAERGSRRVAATYGVLAAVGVVLSLGPDGARSVYAALHGALFAMAAIRAPARFSVLTLCGVAVLAALAVRRLETRLPRARSLVYPAILTVICVEYVNWMPSMPTAPALTSNAGRWLRDQPGSGAVVCLPMGVLAADTACMLQSLEHGRPITNGYSGLRPPFFDALLDTVNRVPDPASLLALHDLGVEYIVTGHYQAIGGPAGDVLVERATFGDQRVYQLVWSPEIESRLASVTERPPPEPGPPPFSVGEIATYQVTWTNGPVLVPAGEASIAVVPPQGTEAFRFVVTAKTAAWVSRFYDADALLETTASRRLLPLAHRETIADGRRRIDRQVTYDSARRQVHVTSGGTSITLPLGLDARDPMSALFYLRTLPMSGGSRFTLPLSDNGRPWTLDVAVDRLESILVEGQPWSAWKIEPRLANRFERHRLTISAWVSADPRHVPLRVEVVAPFGSVRLDLASYRER